MTSRLTIIIPCYNCASTLEEAVSSCFRQGVTTPFEMIMVNDASTDGTAHLLEKLKGLHPEIKVITHPKNQGGGAARNTAVAHASGDIIFCLDGDDLLPDGTLSKMASHLETTKSDGVLIEETHFFDGTNPGKYQIVKNTILDRPVTFADLYRKDCGFLTKVNFMYTKKAHTEAGGYPTNHGFDTQAFGTRFLAKNLRTTVCPGAGYLHRRHNGASYFIREYTNGKLSFNNYLILEEIFYLFSEKIKEEIVCYDIFKNDTLGSNNIEYHLQSLFETIGEEAFFIPNYMNYLTCDGNEKYIFEITHKNKPIDIFTQAVWQYRNKNFAGAYELFTKITPHYAAYPVYRMNTLRCFMSDNDVFSVMYTRPSTLDTFIKLLKKIIDRIKKIL